MDALDARTVEYNDDVLYDTQPTAPRPDMRSRLEQMLLDPKLDDLCRTIIQTVLDNEDATSQQKIADLMGLRQPIISSALQTLRKRHTG